MLVAFLDLIVIACIVIGALVYEAWKRVKRRRAQAQDAHSEDEEGH